MKNKRLCAFAALLLICQPFAPAGEARLLTYADARPDGGIRQGADGDDGRDSPGDIFVFDQKLLADDAATPIGRNAGFCIRTDPGAPDYSGTDHPVLPDDPDNNYSQCSWSLIFEKHSGYRGAIVVSGREADQGTSVLPVIGGTGDFYGVVGVLSTTPIHQGDDGLLFRQELILSRPVDKHRERSRRRTPIHPIR
jgi:hypothetical protein